ncbi:hypothetical protein [Actinomadura rubrisoli]|uniref:Uncharacterized protein n=1 Tax=Actinomadura rubrisoli TaxID=2530368 RepID=A0A4R5ATU9_9ACTN|nr:hypothetical protein [Actinomadura rubrisoli]TDD75420.1 hypothetical protein E1298_31590 [Actinomadura rubrisoli]
MKFTIKVEGKLKVGPLVATASALTTSVAAAAGSYPATGAAGAVALAALSAGGHVVAYRAGGKS